MTAARRPECRKLKFLSIPLGWWGRGSPPTPSKVCLRRVRLIIRALFLVRQTFWHQLGGPPTTSKVGMRRLCLGLPREHCLRCSPIVAGYFARILYLWPHRGGSQRREPQKNRCNKRKSNLFAKQAFCAQICIIFCMREATYISDSFRMRALAP